MKKYNGTTWVDTTLRQYKTATDTTTTLPTVLYPNDTTATVGLKGQTVQSGTPTPDNPIMPQGCGDLETVGIKAGQYKIPISSANTTTPVYLGEVESTRWIKKLVLTGEEDITSASGDNNRVVGHFNIPNMGMNASKTGYCNILLWKREYSQSDYNRIVAYNGSHFYMSLEKTILPTPTIGGFISYLQQQYAAGTPVTIWYVLATPKTAAINEPLMKIGDYADEVSGITVPTITGKDTFDVLTTLKPSEVSLSYTGWHDASVNEWDGSEWQ